MGADNTHETVVANLLTNRPSTVTFLPDPPKEELFCAVISVDDHALEPPDLFVNHLPKKYLGAAPHLEREIDGSASWQIGEGRFPVTVCNGASGRPISEWGTKRAAYEDFRSGVSNPEERLRDMDRCGIWASLCFGSIPWGFAGTRFSQMDDLEAGFACLQAYNDWMIDEWCSIDLDRFIPCQFPWLRDSGIAAQEIHRNANRGFKAVSFSENPEPLGLPSLYTDYWDPFFLACEETETVVNLHVGSSGLAQHPSSQSPAEVATALFPAFALTAAIDWIYARIPLKFPRLKIALSEGGASWVPMAIERLHRAHRQVDCSIAWKKSDPNPVDILLHNFHFCSIEDPAAFRMIDQIGENNLMIEVDYPHFDSSWPKVQAMLRSELEGVVKPDVAEKVCFRNAAKLYRHRIPPRSMLLESTIGKQILEGQSSN